MPRIEKPLRVSHTYLQRLKAPPDKVFPLLCPVRELEWVPGWDPRVVYTSSGHAEPDCVFVTPDGDGEAIWVVTRYEPEQYRLAFVKVTPGVTTGHIHIALEDDGRGGTEAEVTYTYTALSERGRTFVEAYTEEAYATFMQRWEKALNRYLLTGERV